MEDQRNLVIHRAGVVFLPQASNPIQSGEVGEYVDSNNQRWAVAADGTKRAAAGSALAGYPAVRLATNVALPTYAYSGTAQTITASGNGALKIDGVAVAANNRVLVKDGAAGSDNGIYVVTTPGGTSAKFVLTRAADMSASASLVAGALVPVGPEGKVNAGKSFALLTAAPMTLDTTALTFGSDFATERGMIPSARVAFSVNPTANDTLAVGGTTFKFVASLGTAGAQVQVLIGGSASATLTNTIAAINGDTTNANWTEATTPFAGAVVADAVTATVLRVMSATARGGNPAAISSGSVALTASVTGGASAWNPTNLNAMAALPASSMVSVGKVTITAAMISAGSLNIELPFSPTILLYQAQSSAGVLRNPSDVVAVSASTITITLGGGASPNLQANDVFAFLAQQ